MTDRSKDIEEAKQRGIEQFDLQKGMAFDVTTDDVEAITDDLREYEAVDADAEGTEWLAEWVAALKALEGAAEDARKHFEAALDERVETGDSVGELTRVAGTNRYVTDATAAFEAVENAGADPADVAKVSASKLEGVLGEEAAEWIGESSYTYYRRQS